MQQSGHGCSDSSCRGSRQQATWCSLELASYTVRLQLLQVTLQQSARAILSSSTTRSTENKGEDCRAW